MDSEILDPIRVIDGNEMKIYHATAVLNLSAAGLRVTNPIPVFCDGQEVGAADLFVEDGMVKAYFFMDYATPVRLDSQNGERLFASPRIRLNEYQELDYIDSINLGRLGNEYSGKLEQV